MSATLLGAVATAGVLGVTHAIEPDHVAGIASLTSQYGDTRLSALVGACFSLGHVLLVVVWLGIGYLLFGRTEFPAAFDAIGTVGVGLLLAALGFTLAFGGLRRVRCTHGHEHDHGGDHDHGVQSYLKTGVIGALFALSPPLSMILFSSTLLSGGPELVAVAVLAYAVGITVTMSALGAGSGAVFGAMNGFNVRVYGIAQTVTGVLVIGMSTSLLAGVVPLPG